MSFLDDAMRKAGLVESLREVCRKLSRVGGRYASEVYAEIGAALENTINSQFNIFLMR